MNVSSFARQLLARRTIPGQSRIERFVSSLSRGEYVILTILFVLLTFSVLGIFASIRDQVIAEVPAHGGSLTEGVVGSARFVNPVLALSNTDQDLVELVYAGLMKVSGDGSIVPELAENFTLSEDGTIYTFTIREDAYFHDGEAVHADDVVFTISTLQDPAIKSPRIGNWDGVRAEAVDAKTVVFTLTEPYAPFLENTTIGILPKHIWEQVPPEEFPFSQFTTEPIGAGPYQIKAVKRDGAGILKRYELSAFEDYVLGVPYITSINVTFFGSQTELIRALNRSEVDSAHSIIPNVITSDREVLAAPYTRVFGIFFNQNEHPVLANYGVRSALNVALDRKRIVNEVLGGYGTPLTSPLPPQLLTEEYEQAEDHIAFAVEILESRGWEFDTDERVWVNDDDERITLTIRTSSIPEFQAIARIAKENFEAVGIPTAIEFFESSDLQQNVIRPREYQALLFGMVIGRIPDLYAFWHSSQRNDPGLNVALYTNITADDVLADARTESEKRVRDELFETFADEVESDIPAVFTHAPELTYLVPENLRGVTLPAITDASDRFVEVHTWYRETEKVWPFFTY